MQSYDVCNKSCKLACRFGFWITDSSLLVDTHVLYKIVGVTILYRNIDFVKYILILLSLV